MDYDKKNEKAKYLGTKAKLIYYTGESQTPNWNECDLAFTFEPDIRKDNKNYRLPLWAMYLNWFNRPYNPNRDQAYLHNIDSFLNKKIDKMQILKQKTQFCNFVYSNPAQRRVNFYPTLAKIGHRHITSAGRLFNNTGVNISGRSDNIEKIDFLDKFKFTISFENTEHLGYTTEKLIHPMFANSMPVYWGNKNVHNDFNINSFVLADKFPDDESLVEYINTLDTNMDAYFAILEQPWFVDNKIPDYVKPENVLSAIERILK